MDTEAIEGEVRSLPALDWDAITAAAESWVSSRLKDLADPAQRAKAAAKLVISEGKAAEGARIERDVAACSIAAHYRVRRGADIPGALGVNRNRWKVIKEKQAARFGFTTVVTDGKRKGETVGSWDDLMAAPDFEYPRVPDAPAVLPKLAVKAARHSAREAVAMAARDRAVKELQAWGWKNKRIADLIGTDPSRVSHIKHRGNAA